MDTNATLSILLQKNKKEIVNAIQGYDFHFFMVLFRFYSQKYSIIIAESNHLKSDRILKIKRIKHFKQK